MFSFDTRTYWCIRLKLINLFFILNPFYGSVEINMGRTNIRSKQLLRGTFIGLTWREWNTF